MKSDLSNARRGDPQHEPTDLMLLEKPLEFIAEDHLRARAVCETLARIAAARQAPARGDLDEAHVFLDGELPLSLHDEDDDLFAVLRDRTADQEGAAALLAQLAETHATIAAILPGMDGLIRALKDEARPVTSNEAEGLRAFGEALRRMIIVENAVVIPLARRVLTEDDLVGLRCAMIARRVADMHGHGPHVD